MSEQKTPGDYELWRDFKWDEYLASELRKYPLDERQQLKDAVRIAREFARVFSTSKPTIDDVHLIMRLEQDTCLRTIVLALTLLAQIGGIYYRGKRQGDDKLDFALTAIAYAAQKCKEGDFQKVLPILTRFAKEFGE